MGSLSAKAEFDAEVGQRFFVRDWLAADGEVTFLFRVGQGGYCLLTLMATYQSTAHLEVLLRASGILMIALAEDLEAFRVAESSAQ